jgi:hypothetical protein
MGKELMADDARRSGGVMAVKIQGIATFYKGAASNVG